MYDDILERHRPVLDGTDESAGRFTQRVAWDLRATHVLIRKAGGTRCDGPGGGIDCDKVMQREAPHAIYDIVVSAGGPENRPGWSHARNHDGSLAYGRPEMGVEPEPYAAGPGPSPTPPPPAPGPDLSAILAELAAIRAGVARAEEQARRATDAAREAVDALRHLPAPPAPTVPAVTFPVYRGSFALPGWLGGDRGITLTPEAS